MNAKQIQELTGWNIKDIRKALKEIGSTIDFKKAFDNRQSFDFFKLWYTVYHINDNKG